MYNTTSTGTSTQHGRTPPHCPPHHLRTIRHRRRRHRHTSLHRSPQTPIMDKGGIIKLKTPYDMPWLQRITHTRSHPRHVPQHTTHTQRTCQHHTQDTSPKRRRPAPDNDYVSPRGDGRHQKRQLPTPTQDISRRSRPSRRCNSFGTTQPSTTTARGRATTRCNGRGARRNEREGRAHNA